MRGKFPQSLVCLIKGHIECKCGSILHTTKPICKRCDCDLRNTLTQESQS